MGSCITRSFRSCIKGEEIRRTPYNSNILYGSFDCRPFFYACIDACRTVGLSLALIVKYDSCHDVRNIFCRNSKRHAPGAPKVSSSMSRQAPMLLSFCISSSLKFRTSDPSLPAKLAVFCRSSAFISRLSALLSGSRYLLLPIQVSETDTPSYVCRYPVSRHIMLTGRTSDCLFADYVLARFALVHDLPDLSFNRRCFAQAFLSSSLGEMVFLSSVDLRLCLHCISSQSSRCATSQAPAEPRLRNNKGPS